MNTNTKSNWAVITGASSGIGYELAKVFAEEGFDLLIASHGPAIVETAQALKQYGTNVQSLQVDLSTEEGTEELYRQIKAQGRPLDVICLNAGVGIGGASFDKTDLKAEMDLIRLNIMSVVHLTKLVLKDMVAQQSGKILFTSSIAAFMPGPYESVYSASKAFVQSFAEGLMEENKDKGITITALQPGPTETNFFHRAGMDDTKIADKKKDDPAMVARAGFEALMKGKDRVVAGLKNKIEANVARVLPQTMSSKLHKTMTLPNDKADR